MGKLDLAASHIAPDIVGTAVDYPGLRKLIAERRKELGLSQLAVDEMAGVQTGYTGKIECGARHFGDMSLGSILGALGIELGIMRAAGTYAGSCETSKASIDRKIIARKNMAAKGGRARAAKMNAKQRSESARHAVKKRWRDWRAVKAEQKRKQRRGGK